MALRLAFLFILAALLLPLRADAAGSFAMLQVSRQGAQFAPLLLDGGGWITGGEQAPDGTTVVRSDTYGAYIWNIGTSAWSQLLTSSSMPAGSFYYLDSNSDYIAGLGVYEIQVCPQNSSDLALHYDGYIFTSTNKGATWIKTSYSRDFNQTATGENQNDSYRMNQQKMAFDPNNCNVIYVGNPTSSGGLWVTTNFGSTWAQVSGIPASTADSNTTYPGLTGIVFDPSSGTTGGDTNTIYAAVFGHGVYQSTNAGSSWSLISSSPQYVEFATVIGGVYYCTCIASTSGVTGGGSPNAVLMNYSGGSWNTVLSSTNNGVQILVVDPNTPGHWITIDGGSGIYQTTNSGSSWTGRYTTSQFSSFGWQNLLNSSSTTIAYASIGTMFFDPSVPNKLWITHGNGVAETTSLTASSTTSDLITWNDISAGINNMVGRVVIGPASGPPVLSVEDRQEFVISSLTSYPTTFGVAGQHNQVAGWSVDEAKSSQSTIVALNNWFVIDESGYSSNSGSSWSTFGTAPTGSGSVWTGGSIAASTPSNFVVVPGQVTSTTYYTTNGGTSWSAATGLPGSGYPGDRFNNTHNLCADWVTPNTFYLYLGNNNGTYTSTNGGASWTQASSTVLDNATYNSTLLCVPGNAGNLFYTAGGGQGQAHPNGVPLYFSSNGASGGTPWTPVPNVQDVWAIGTGAAGSGETYPRIFFVGWGNCSASGFTCPAGLSGGTTGYQYGIWLAKNDFATAERLVDYPFGSIDEIYSISGDQSDPTKVYYAFGGSSGGYGININ